LALDKYALDLWESLSPSVSNDFEIGGLLRRRQILREMSQSLSKLRTCDLEALAESKHLLWYRASMNNHLLTLDFTDFPRFEILKLFISNWEKHCFTLVDYYGKQDCLCTGEREFVAAMLSAWQKDLLFYVAHGFRALYPKLNPQKWNESFSLMKMVLRFSTVSLPFGTKRCKAKFHGVLVKHRVCCHVKSFIGAGCVDSACLFCWAAELRFMEASSG
jgi:hypothetical protein